MQQDELARNEAWRSWMKFRESEDQDAPAWRRLHIAWDAGWDARGRYDEQRIAELEVALSDLVQAVEGEHNSGVPVTRSIRMNAMLRAAKSALGQSEEVKP